MSVPDFFIPIDLALRTQEQVGEFGDYDAPCFISVYTTLESEGFGDALDQCGYDADLDLEDYLTIEAEGEKRRLFFLSSDGNYRDIAIFADSLAMHLQEHRGYVSVFRHNPIGEAQETLFWSWSQLLRLVESSDNTVRVAINDFKDRQRWPGLSDCPDFWEAKKEFELSESKQETGGFFKGLIQAIAAVFLGKKEQVLAEAEGDAHVTEEEAQWQKVADELWPFSLQSGLEQLAPFIYHLPNGDALWRYVLSGDGRESLDEQDQLLNLDGVLIFAHAKRYAPAFYRRLDRCVRGVSEQSDILDDLLDILQDLRAELLEADGHEHERQPKVDCFLRVLDIFFHLLDQQTPDTDMFEFLVEEQACISREDYRQRYRVQQQVAEGCITDEQTKALKAMIRSLKSFYFADYDELKAMGELRLESRAIADISLWDIENKPHELLLIAMMLASDHAEGINDDYRIAAQQRLDQHFVPTSLKTLSRYFDGDMQSIETWLNSDGNDAELRQQVLRQLQGGLKLTSYNGRRDVPQPSYECLDSVSKFVPMLVAAFYCKQVQLDGPAARLLEVFLLLAPQKTLDWCSRLYRDGFRGFANDEATQEFERLLINLNPDFADGFVFMQRLYAKSDTGCYQQQIQRYLGSNEEERRQFDQSFSRLFLPHQQRFYFDVWLADEHYQPPVKDLWRNAFAAIHRKVSLFHDDVFAAVFDKKQIAFVGRCEYLPEEFDLDTRTSEYTRENPCWHGPEPLPLPISYSVLRAQKDHLELVLEAPGAAAEEHPNINNLVVLHSSVTNEQIDEALNKLAEIYQSGQTTENTIADALERFVAGELSFADYHKRIQYLVEDKDYDFIMENQSKYAARILTAIRMEPNQDKQLRLIKALTVNPVRGPKLREEVALRLYLDKAYRRQEVDRKDLNGFELGDLAPSARAGVREVLATIQQAMIEL